jgi:DNA mismatch repair protein MutS2
MSRPDLLHETPTPASQSRGLSQALTFGFARGVDEKRLLELAAPPLTETHFKREAFAGDLFVDELIRANFGVLADGPKASGVSDYFKRLLLAPPKELLDVTFRQRVFSELCQEDHRLELVKKAYSSLLGFRDALCGTDHFSAKTLGVRRRIDILIALRRSMDDLLAASGSSRTGLERAAFWVEETRATDAYQSLERLLSFEDGRAVLETRLQVGYDGSLRRFEVVGTQLIAHPGFPRSALGRFYRRLISLLKGYRFSEEDVMSQLLDQVFSGLEHVVGDLLSLSLQLEFYLRGMGFRAAAQGHGLEVCLPTVVSKKETSRSRVLDGLFNPWLAGQGVVVVPCDFFQEEHPTTTIVTGPNSGGKTRLLQSLAITQLLAQVGLFVPARRAIVPEVEQLFLSLIEHVQSDQNEGRLGVELLRVRQVFETSGSSSLVLMDELCSGTNPSEGERIFQMVLDLFEELGSQVLVSTHFLDFAQRLSEERGEKIAFLQVEMDPDEHPTYQFVPGVAKTSLARNTAARLGVTREELLALVRKHQHRD